MPVITPNYPCMCSTHNVTKSTKSVILREMERANGIVNEIMNGNAPWSKLFERHTFFTQDYKVYLRVLAAARTKEEQLKWYAVTLVNLLGALTFISGRGWLNPNFVISWQNWNS